MHNENEAWAMSIYSFEREDLSWLCKWRGTKPLGIELALVVEGKGRELGRHMKLANRPARAPLPQARSHAQLLVYVLSRMLRFATKLPTAYCHLTHSYICSKTSCKPTLILNFQEVFSKAFNYIHLHPETILGKNDVPTSKKLNIRAIKGVRRHETHLFFWWDGLVLWVKLLWTRCHLCKSQRKIHFVVLRCSKSLISYKRLLTSFSMALRLVKKRKGSTINVLVFIHAIRRLGRQWEK